MNRFSLMGKIYNKMLYRINKTKFAKKIGVSFKGNLKLYGKVEFGTEPWLIELGENVYLTDGVKFICHDGGTLIFREQVPDLEITKPIKLGNNVYVGNNVIFLPGVSVGDNVVIGAGAVVSRDLPSDCVAVGVPAKPIKSIDEYFEKIKRESIHLGHLKGKEKDDALRRYFKSESSAD